MSLICWSKIKYSHHVVPLSHNYSQFCKIRSHFLLAQFVILNTKNTLKLTKGNKSGKCNKKTPEFHIQISKIVSD